MSRPVPGTVVPFDSTATTPTTTRTVVAGEVVCLFFGIGNNNSSALTISDNMGGASADWVTYGEAINNRGCGVRMRKMPSAGTLTVTLGKDGAAFYVGESIGFTGVNPAVFDGAAVGTSFAASPGTVTPSAPASATDTLCIAFWSGVDSRFALISAHSDTLLATNNSASIACQVYVETRNAVAGAQAPMTVTFGAGTSGLDARGAMGVINLFGVPPPATLSALGTASVADVQAVGQVTSNQAAGTVYFAVTPTSVSPSGPQIEAGTGGGIASAASAAAVVGAVTGTFNGLTASTTYYEWAIQNNGTSDSAIVGPFAFTTTPPAPTISAVSSATPLDGSSVTFTVGNAGATQGAGGLYIDVGYGFVAQTVTAWSATSITVNIACPGKYGAAANVKVVSGTTGLSSAVYTGVTGIQPPAGYSFINIVTPNPTASKRVTCAALDIVAGAQLAYENKSNTVTLFNDGSGVVPGGSPSFMFKALDPATGLWGTPGLQTFN